MASRGNLPLKGRRVGKLACPLLNRLARSRTPSCEKRVNLFARAYKRPREFTWRPDRAN